MPSCRSSLPSDITSSFTENNDKIKSLIVKQCTEELISPIILANRHKKSERTIRNSVTSSGAQLPLKYREKSQQKIAVTSNYKDHSLVSANNATQQLTKQLVLNLKSNWPSLSNTIESQLNSSNSRNCETISLEPDLENKSKIDENKLGRKKIIPVLDLEELTVDRPSQKSLTENQSLVTNMLTCSKDNCGFKTKLKRGLDLHIKGKR